MGESPDIRFYTCPWKFWLTHLWWLAPAAGAVWGLQVSGWDERLAWIFYAWQGHAWRWQDSWLLETLIHRQAKYFLIGVYLLLLALAVASLKKPSLLRYRRGLWYLIVAIPLGTLTVSWLKGVTHMDCPWDLVQFGGTKPYVGLFETHPGTFSYGRCFPAAHASAAFSWFALYFFARVYYPQWRWHALAAVALLGLVFGLAQQLRGAHFLSHDLASAMVTWLVSLALFALFFCRRRITSVNRKKLSDKSR